MRYTLRFIGMINKTEKKNTFFMVIWRHAKNMGEWARQCSWDQGIVCAGVCLLEIIVVIAISACVHRHTARACTNNFTLYKIINIVQWLLSIPIHHMRRWILFRQFSLLLEYCVFVEYVRVRVSVWTRHKTRTVISQLWKSFVWLFSFRSLFFKLC